MCIGTRKSATSDERILSVALPEKAVCWKIEMCCAFSSRLCLLHTTPYFEVMSLQMISIFAPSVPILTGIVPSVFFEIGQLSTSSSSGYLDVGTTVFTYWSMFPCNYGFLATNVNRTVPFLMHVYHPSSIQLHTVFTRCNGHKFYTKLSLRANVLSPLLLSTFNNLNYNNFAWFGAWRRNPSRELRRIQHLPTDTRRTPENIFFSTGAGETNGERMQYAPVLSTLARFRKHPDSIVCRYYAIYRTPDECLVLLHCRARMLTITTIIIIGNEPRRVLLNRMW